MSSTLKIAIGSDHAGFELKAEIMKHFADIEFKDFGCYSTDSVDYPDFAHAVAKAIEAKDSTLGILICGSGNGISIAANKHQGIRAALCWEPELASLARQHNDANVLSLPARFVSTEKAIEIVKAYLAASFEGGRHANRVNKIACQ